MFFFLHHFKWCMDFAKARNYSLTCYECKSDYQFWCDGDDELNAKSRSKKKKNSDFVLPKPQEIKQKLDEYVIGLSAAYQMTDTTQVAVYGEYTLDTAHEQSQNGTDVKAELGVRLNVQF